MSEDKPVGDREVWDEYHAVQFEGHAAYIREQIPEWIKRAGKNFHSDSLRHAYEAAIRAEHYDSLASQMRQPRYTRLEREAYERLKP